MQSPGRPHALDDQKCSEICDLVSSGHSVAQVARLMGCNVKTIRRHAQWDERFGRLLRVAEISAKNDPLKMMRRAAGGSWRAAAWLLERTDPERYSKQPPATCRPEDVDRAFTRIMEAALGLVPGEAPRRALYQSLAQVMEEETVELFLPSSVKRANPKCDPTVHVDGQRLQDLLDSLSRPEPPKKPAAAPKKSTDASASVRGPAPGDPKTQPPKSPSTPGENTSRTPKPPILGPRPPFPVAPTNPKNPKTC